MEFDSVSLSERFGRGKAHNEHNKDGETCRHVSTSFSSVMRLFAAVRRYPGILWSYRLILGNPFTRLIVTPLLRH